MSRHQVTITLGRSGQVVKRERHVNVSDNSRFNSFPLSGSKRSIRDRLGSNADNLFYGRHPNNKRRREDQWSPNDAWVDPNDLRFKLMRKNRSRQTRSDNEEQNHLNLRGKRPRTIRSPVSTYTLQRMPERKATGPLRRLPPTRSADDLLQLNSLKRSYSAWSHGGLRCSSPDRILGASRCLSPSKSINDLRQVPTYTPIYAPRAAPRMGRNVYDLAESARSIPFLAKTNLPLEVARPGPRLPPPRGISQKSSYLGKEPLTVGKFLHSLGLGKYAILFQAEEVDMMALRQMRDNDLKELGIPMGPRRKIILALLHH